MTRSTSPNITPRTAAHNDGELPLRLPRREELGANVVGLLKHGDKTKADLRIVDLGEGRIVVKDFADKAWWVRLIGRFQIARECRAYRWLGPLPGLPRFLGRIDAHALALEWIDGQQLAVAPDRREGGEGRLDRLREIVERLHRTGLTHLDLRGRENVMLDPEGRIYILDLASAIWFRPGGLPHRLFSRWFELTDEAALLKWKRMLSAGPYTEEEEDFLRRYRFWRSLWLLNRKRHRKKGGR